MTKYKMKTTKNNRSVSRFLNSVKDPVRKKDSKFVLKLMKEITGKKPKMWGDSIIGFGDYHYKYKSGHEGESFLIGFSPRSEALTIYIMPGYQNFDKYLKKLGPYKKGKSCLYLKNLENNHIPILKKMIEKGYKDMIKKYPQ